MSPIKPEPCGERIARRKSAYRSRIGYVSRYGVMTVYPIVKAGMCGRVRETTLLYSSSPLQESHNASCSCQVACIRCALSSGGWMDIHSSLSALRSSPRVPSRRSWTTRASTSRTYCSSSSSCSVGNAGSSSCWWYTPHSTWRPSRDCPS